MTTTRIGPLPVQRWGRALLGPTHVTVIVTVAWAVVCLLAAQRITPAALARALPSERAGSGRSRLRRVRRWWTGPPLDHVLVSPALLRSTLGLLPPGQAVVVALDTPGAVGSLAGRRGGRRPHPAHWLGSAPVSLAQRPVPPHHRGPSPAAPGRRPGRASLGPRRRPGFSECAALYPPPAPRDRVQCAAPLARLGDRGGGLCDGLGSVGGWTLGRGAPGDRHDGA